MNELRLLEIAADHVERDGYVLYGDFDEQRPVNQTGNKFLFFVRRCLLEGGYYIHMRRNAAEWGMCSYPGDHSHFHRNSTTT
jgi:hypothetical protein